MAQNKNNNKNGGDCCSFCGAKRTDVEIMFQGSDGANICNKCIENGYKIIVDNDIASERGRRPAAAPLKMEELLKPAQIKEFLDQYVIGQDDAKRYMSVAVYNHYKRLLYAPRTTTSSSTSRTSSSWGPPVRARRSWRARSPGCSRCLSRSSTPPC